MDRPLARTLVALSAAAVLVPLLLVFVVIVALEQQQFISELQARLASAAALQCRQIDGWLDGRSAALRLLAGQPDVLAGAQALLSTPPDRTEYAQARQDVGARLAAAQASDGGRWSRSGGRQACLGRPWRPAMPTC